MAAGWIKSYTHTFDFQSALQPLVLRPAPLGTNWYEGFNSSDAQGVVQVSGRIRGGHEIVVDETATERQLVGFQNSWGTAYGVEGGRFYMPHAVLKRMIAEQGIAVPIR